MEWSNYGFYASPNIHNFDFSFDDEDNFDIFDMNNNNEIEQMCLFEENSDNNDKISENGKSFDNYQSTETISFSSYYITFNDLLFNVIKNNNEISTFIADMLLEMKEVINYKNNHNLNLDRLIAHFSKFKNIFTPLEKKIRLVLIEPKKLFLKNH